MWSEHLIDRLGARASELPRDALEVTLDKLLAEAEARLPHKPVTRKAFLDRLAEALLATEQIDLARVRGADLYFAAALAARDEAALALAETELMTAARHAVRKIDDAGPFVDEVVQRVRDRLFVGDAPAIAQYRGSGPLGGWVRVVARRIALDLKRQSNRETGDELDELPAPDDPELAMMWKSAASEYKLALQAAFAKLERRERNLLRQRYVDDLSIDALGRLYKVDPSTAYRWIEKAQQRLVETTRGLLVAKLKLTDSQAHSLERVVANNLHLSISGMLRGKRQAKKEK